MHKIHKRYEPKSLIRLFDKDGSKNLINHCKNLSFEQSLCSIFKILRIRYFPRTTNYQVISKFISFYAKSFANNSPA